MQEKRSGKGASKGEDEEAREMAKRPTMLAVECDWTSKWWLESEGAAETSGECRHAACPRLAVLQKRAFVFLQYKRS